MKNLFSKNCCDGVYNSIDVHFTSACDNKCTHCIDTHYQGTGVKRPDARSIVDTITENKDRFDDVLFLGGEPCLYLDELITCVEKLKENTDLKLFVTTAVPKTCFDKSESFSYLISLLDGINLSVQHYKEGVADEIRKTESKYDRQKFYKSLPHKDKIRINLNIVKPYLYTKEDITNCIKHYDRMNFYEIKLSEIQHGTDKYVSFEKTFSIKNMKSPFYGGCQTNIGMDEIGTPIILKRSCFMCEETLKASFMDGVKACHKVFYKAKNNYGVVYEDGTLTDGWR